MIVKSPNEPRFLRVREVAVLTSLSESTVWNMIWAGTLPSFRLGPGGKGVRVDRVELERWLEARRAGR
jgi:excisionase family DNA binding protein